MKPIAYAAALRTLALWTSGQASSSEAQLAWNELAAAEYTTVTKPVSPVGFLALLFGDEDFRAGLASSVEKASKAAGGAIAGGLKVLLGLVVAAGAIGAIAVGVMAYRGTAPRRAVQSERRRT